MRRAMLLAAAGALALALPAVSRGLEAAEPESPGEARTSLGALDLATPLPSWAASPGTLSLALAEPALGGSAEARPTPPKNYWIPVLEITAWNIIQNRWSYHFGDTPVYDVSWETWKYNLSHWWWDEDQFSTNGFAHPYMGNLYYNMARSTGLSFWESAAYAFGGSLMWEYFGETEPPSVNDQITTPWGGTIMGEILFRLSNRVLDAGGSKPGFWHELGALALDPAAGFNRILFGNKYRPNDIGGEPFFAGFRLSAGVASDAIENGVSRNPGIPLAINARVINGGPGTGYVLRKPFDHFDADFLLVLNKDSGGSNKGFISIMLRGTVAAWMYGEGTSSGFHGLYFDYEYVAPAVYRVGSNTVGYGATAQVDWGDWAFQYHGLLGLGFGAAGAASDADIAGNRDYHFGGQGALQLEGTFYYRDMFRIALRAREYLTGSKITDAKQTWEDITYATLSFTWRFSALNAIGIQGLGSRRTAHYPDLPEDIRGKVTTLTVFYELVTDPGMGRGR